MHIFKILHMKKYANKNIENVYKIALVTLKKY